MGERENIGFFCGNTGFFSRLFVREGDGADGRRVSVQCMRERENIGFFSRNTGLSCAELLREGDGGDGWCV